MEVVGRWLQAGTTGPIKECYLEGGRGMVSKVGIKVYLKVLSAPWLPSLRLPIPRFIRAG